jgi:hypothetical protein
MGGTPEFLLDTRKGLYSYQALQSRLAENRFVKDGLVDYSGPVLRLASLTAEDLFVLLGKLRHVYAAGVAEKYLIPDDGLQAFMLHCSQKIGDAYFRTPRNTVTAFVNLLAVLEQNPGVAWHQLVERVQVTIDTNPDLAPLEQDDENGEQTIDSSEGEDLASFKL